MVLWLKKEMIQFKVDGVVIKTVQPPEGGFFELGKFPGDVSNPWVNGSNPRMAPFDENVRPHPLKYFRQVYEK